MASNTNDNTSFNLTIQLPGMFSTAVGGDYEVEINPRIVIKASTRAHRSPGDGPSKSMQGPPKQARVARQLWQVTYMALKFPLHYVLPWNWLLSDSSLAISDGHYFRRSKLAGVLLTGKG
jgi:hypothetical protein